MDRLLRRLARSSWRRGIRGEHWAWFALAIAAFVLRRARKASEDTVTLAIRPGERYTVGLADPRLLRPGDDD